MACEDGGDGKSPQQHVCGQQWVQARVQEFRGYSVWGLPPVPIPLPLPLPYSTVATSAARLRPPQRQPRRPQCRLRPQRETTAMTTTTTAMTMITTTTMTTMTMMTTAIDRYNDNEHTDDRDGALPPPPLPALTLPPPIWPPPLPSTRSPLPLALRRSRTSIFLVAVAISALLCFRVSRDAALPAALRIPDLVVRRSFKVVLLLWMKEVLHHLEHHRPLQFHGVPK